LRDANSNSYGNANRHGHGNSHSHAQRDAYSFTNSIHLPRLAYSPTQRHTKNTANPAAAPVAFAYENKTHCPIRVIATVGSNLGVNGNAKSRVFHIAPGKTVAISALTITNGYANNQPVLDGGGMYNDHATLTLGNCTISNNSAFRDGGGVHNAGAATMTLNGCVINGNGTGNDGGGVCNDGT